MLEDTDIPETAPTFTEDDYHARRAGLHNDLRAARSIHDGVALQVETGKRPIEDMREARERIADVEGRITGLEGAWVVAQQIAAAETEAERLRRRALDGATILSVLAERGRLAREIQDGVAAIGLLWRAFNEQSIIAVNAARPWIQGDNLMAGMVDQLASGTGEQRWIAGALFNEGLDRLNEGNVATGARYSRETPLIEQIAQVNHNARVRMCRGIPELKD